MDSSNPRASLEAECAAEFRSDATEKDRIDSSRTARMEATSRFEGADSPTPDPRILVVDDEPKARSVLRNVLARKGFAVIEATGGAEALACLRRQGADVVLANAHMAGMDGVTLVRTARKEGSPAHFVMTTDLDGIEAAVNAMRAGAENMLVKPLKPSVVLVVLEKVLEKWRLAHESTQLRERVRQRYCFEAVIGQSPALQAVFDVLKRAAPTKANILLIGEAGTGKELLAQAIHQQSTRHDKPFVSARCAALSDSMLESELFGAEGCGSSAPAPHEGSFELAQKGTLFLDEVGDLPQSVQVKLARALDRREFERIGGTQTQRVDVRIIAATTRDLAAEVAARRFREDLFYRLNVVVVKLPPLRARKGDIPGLVSHFLQRFNQKHGKSIQGLLPGTLNALLGYDWPGNVRELETVIERAVFLAKGEDLAIADLPPVLRGRDGVNPDSGEVTLGATLREIERAAILRTLELVKRSTSRASVMLGISVRTIQYRLKEYATENESSRKAVE
jgi:two-component system, NtrC family, response regulator